MRSIGTSIMDSAFPVPFPAPEPLPPGWLTQPEAEVLERLARGRTVLEIGSFRGRSTVAMARVAKRVFALDWFRGDKNCGSAFTLPAFLDALAYHHVEDKVVILAGRVEELAPYLVGPFDMVYVDGAHDEESVERDTRLAVRLTTRG